MYGEQSIRVPEKLKGQISSFPGGFSFSLSPYEYTAAKMKNILREFVSSGRIPKELPIPSAFVRASKLLDEMVECFGATSDPRLINGRIVAERIFVGVCDNKEVENTLKEFQAFMTEIQRPHEVSSSELCTLKKLQQFFEHILTSAQSEVLFRRDMDLEGHDFKIS